MPNQTNQEMIKDMVKATADESSEYRSMQELLRALHDCVELDEETGLCVIRVKSAE